ncbi:MAG: GNAT family N-acetyltransferase [Planctomycetota bacterium]|jgi:putative acetyltransferase
MVTIREEEIRDIGAIRNITEAVFDGPAEANVVDKLRRVCDECSSVVAVDGDEVVGHVMFSPATIENGDGVIRGMGLAPMAVLPIHQRKGIGTALIEFGLEMLCEKGCPFVIVLGHADYYPRFGFVPASRHNLRSQWEGIPDEAFMILVFNQESLKGVRGVAKYREEFNEAMEEPIKGVQ